MHGVIEGYARDEVARAVLSLDNLDEAIDLMVDMIEELSDERLADLFAVAVKSLLLVRSLKSAMIA